jgi:hypothetical protein
MSRIARARPSHLGVCMGVLLCAATSAACGSSAYTSIRAGDNGTYYLTRNRQVFGAVAGELLWCEPIPPDGNLRCRVVGE